MEQDGYIRIEQIAEDLTEHPLLRDIPIDRIVNYAQEFIKKVGAPKLFYEKVAVIKIENYRGQLPCDFAEIIQVRGAKDHEEYVAATNTFHMDHPDVEKKPVRDWNAPAPIQPAPIDKNNPPVSMKCCPPMERDLMLLPTYKIQGNMIFSSRKNCDVEIAYRGIPIDENGWPMFPDNAEFIGALEAYIKVQRFVIFFDMGQINANVLNNAQQDYAWKVGQAQVGLIRPTLDEMETITNIWHNLIPNMTAHRNGFATLHNKEYIKRH